ncbi:MAG: hypothetical protein K2M78_03720 [Lachnospiraceae bacterium]|nr:hypothetical protein [Lachnospiraceae bacterium]
MKKVEFLLILDKEECYLGNYASLTKTFELSNSTVCKGNDTIEYDGINIKYIIDRIKNKSLIYDIIFEIENDDKDGVQKFETFINSYKALIKSLKFIKTLEEIWNDIGAYYAELAYPEINHLENKMRYLISKFMYFQENYNWTSTHISDKLKMSESERGKTEDILFAVDFIKLTDILFNEYPIKKIDQLKKEINNETSSIEVGIINDYLPKSNWDRYFEKHLDIKADTLKKLWKEIYMYRCIVAHNRNLSSKDYIQLHSKVEKVSLMLDNAIEKIPKITLSQQQILLAETNSSIHIISSDEYFACLNRSNASAATSFDIEEYYPKLYQSMLCAKDLIEKRGFLTSNIIVPRNILCSIAFDIFKKNDSNTYYHIGFFQGDYVENEDKAYFSFWRVEGKIVSPKNDSDYTILAEVICDYFEYL